MNTFQRKRLSGTDHGFSLMELIATMIIMGLLAAIALPVYTNQRAKANKAAAESDARSVATEMVEMFGDVTDWGATPYMVDTLTNERLSITFYNTGGTPTSDDFDLLISTDSEYYDGYTPDSDYPYSYCVVIKNHDQYARASDQGYDSGGDVLTCDPDDRVA